MMVSIRKNDRPPLTLTTMWQRLLAFFTQLKSLVASKSKKKYKTVAMSLKGTTKISKRLRS